MGIMGEIAKATLGAGGQVTGVMPRSLVEKEVAFTELADLRVVDSMHERKALMVELSDGRCLATNRKLLENNIRLGCQIAKRLAD